MKQFIQTAIGILFSFCLMITLLFTSIEAVVYWTPGYFEKEYTKYNVTDDVQMTMEDLLQVTDEMMAYLRGNREDLHVDTTMGGVQREFFNEREIAHMEDVQGLFLDAISLRRGCLLIMALCIIILLLLKADFKRRFPLSVLIGTGIFFGAAVVLAIIISTDFNKYFVMFHHMFFNNDLWILDSATDMLINIVPEGFFSDTVFRICTTFFTGVLVILGICAALLFKHKKTDK